MFQQIPGGLLMVPEFDKKINILSHKDLVINKQVFRQLLFPVTLGQEITRYVLFIFHHHFLLIAIT